MSREGRKTSKREGDGIGRTRQKKGGERKAGSARERPDSHFFFSISLSDFHLAPRSLPISPVVRTTESSRNESSPKEAVEARRRGERGEEAGRSETR